MKILALLAFLLCLAPNAYSRGGGGYSGGGGGGYSGGYSSRYSGGYHSRSGRRGRSDPGFLIFMAIVVGIIKLKEHFSGRSGGDDRVPEVIIPRRNISAKAEKTEALLRSLAASDRSMDPVLMKNAASSIFTKLQMCWTARDYAPIKDLLTPYLYASHSAKLETMRHNNEINVMADVQLRAVDLVLVNCAGRPEDRLFTALITASARDYYIDDRDNSFLRGDSSAKEFQEFWTFRFGDGKWKLAVIEQTTESEALSRDNVASGNGGFQGTGGFSASSAAGAALSFGGGGTAAGLTDTVPTGGPEADSGPGPAFTPREPSGGWSRTAAELSASLIFLDVYAAWEKGDADALPKNEVLPEMQQAIRAMIKAYRADGMAFRFEDLAVSKAEPVLVNGPGEEFVARINAVAKKTLMRKGNTVYQDPFATPFTEYWVFEKQGGRWKLKELLPRIDGRKVLAGDDQETDSTPVQMEWYYRAGGRA